MTTMADVAKHAGVSVTTVSHVINQTRTIKPDTRARVLDAIASTGFVVNTLARSLATSSTATIGLAASAVQNFYFADMVAAIDAAVRAAGSTLLLADTHEDPDNEFDIVRSLYSRRVDGILLAPVSGREDAALNYLRELRIPAVLIDRCPADDFDQVGVENIQSTRQLSGHLAEVGHRRIGMVTGVPGLQTTVERIEGYRLGLQAHGLAADPGLIISGESDAAGAEAATDMLLSRPDPPTALVIGNNHMTIGALRALKRNRIRVPEDVALAVFDDFDWADVFSPHLTSIAQPIRHIAERAVQMLFARIGGQATAPTTERPAGIWRHRESCGCQR